MARSSKSAKSKSSRSRRGAPVEENDGVMLRMILALLVLGGIAFASATVRIGDTTVLEHMRGVVGWEGVVAVSKPTPTVTKAVERELRQPMQKSPTTPASAPSVASLGDNPPAEVIDAADRAALEKLLEQ